MRIVEKSVGLITGDLELMRVVIENRLNIQSGKLHGNKTKTQSEMR